jgi:hypothetical protein
MKNNHIDRADAGWSATTLLGCPRAEAIRATYDWYESIESGWNKQRGSWLHYMLESDDDYPEYVVKEQRIAKSVHVLGESVRITGKPDYTNTKRGVLIDYKSKHTLPTKPDASHEAQFNIYAWLWKGGAFVKTGEIVDVDIVGGGMHYITWNTKKMSQFKKMAYPVWPIEQTELFVIDRVVPLVQWKQSGVLPVCSPYMRFPGKWRCDCEKLEEQLAERGIYL